jgi:hypothetical protein
MNRDFRNIDILTKEESAMLELTNDIKQTWIKLEDLQQEHIKLTGKRFEWLK